MVEHPCNGIRVAQLPSLTCDISYSPRRGWLYLCWSYMPDYGTNANIYFVRSTDGGLTWTDTLRVNDDRAARMHCWPWMEAHPFTGDIGIS